jgi:hypothetical protein
VKLNVDAEEVEVDLAIPGLEKTDVEGCEPWVRDEAGEAMEPVAHFTDGTTIYFHCPPEGTAEACGYRVDSPRPHHWEMSIDKKRQDGQEIRVARLNVQLD